MRYILIGIGSILAILFIVQLNKGKKYEAIVENLDGDLFPLNQLYGVVSLGVPQSYLHSKGKEQRI